MRSLYFSKLGVDALRHGISIEDLQLAIGDRSHRVGELWLADLVLSLACARGSADAWSQLRTEHSWRLRDAYRSRCASDREGFILERFWHELRVDTESQSRAALGLNAYRGDRPLTIFLASRLVALLERERVGAWPILQALDSRKSVRTFRNSARIGLVTDSLAT